ncbi:hypothetical protein BKA70DRAFT_1184384 [Coprinopsis sp. MPI-PUGE-AT-0042]|nr:hypothetical protein BKA70DRAFT_1184384 [Coprinopsis sp. MPI-PUGE-AT-0042]
MIYKLSVLLAPLLLVASALGQSTFISVPQPGTSLSSGDTFTVQIQRPAAGMMASTEVGFAIGIVSCSRSSSCPPGDSLFGQVLYNGPYRPQRYEAAPVQPYQNFTLTLPELPKGLAQINTVRLHMIGAGPGVMPIEINSVQIQVV